MLRYARRWLCLSRESEVDPAPCGPPISRQEIFQAIQNELEQNGDFRVGRNCGRRILTIQSSVPALCGDIGVKVKRIRFDPFRRRDSV